MGAVLVGAVRVGPVLVGAVRVVAVGMGASLGGAVPVGAVGMAAKILQFSFSFPGPFFKHFSFFQLFRGFVLVVWAFATPTNTQNTQIWSSLDIL